MSMATDGKVIVLEKKMLELTERIRKLEQLEADRMEYLTKGEVKSPAEFKPARATRLG